MEDNATYEIGHLLLDPESRAVKRYVKSVFQRNRDAAVRHYGRRNSRGANRVQPANSKGGNWWQSPLCGAHTESRRIL
jgi:hypothetical protein